METRSNVGSLLGHILRPMDSGLASRQHAMLAALPISLESEAFENHHPIPKKYSAEGANVSPPLHWSKAPRGSRELLLICEDPDAPRETPFIHWILYDIPSEVNALHEGLPRGPVLQVPHGVRQGNNSKNEPAYMGPLPPVGHGVHHYYFQLFAIDIHLESVDSEDRPGLIQRLENHIVGYGELVGTYERA